MPLHPLLQQRRFGSFGGEYVPDLLGPAVDEIREGLETYLDDPAFQEELNRELKTYAGRPTALTNAPRLAAQYGLKQVWLKREDLVHGGAHKLNNVMGQVLLAKRLGKKELIAETGAAMD